MRQGTVPLEIMVVGTAENEQVGEGQFGQGGEVVVLSATAQVGETDVVVFQVTTAVQAGPQHWREQQQDRGRVVGAGGFFQESEPGAVFLLVYSVVFFDKAAVDDDVASRFIGHLQHPGQQIGLDPIVRIQEIHIVARRGLDAAVAGLSGPGIDLLADVSQAAVFPGPALDERGGTIRGHIVHTDDFQVLQVLPKDGIQAPVQVLFRIENRDDDRYLSHAGPS